MLVSGQAVATDPLLMQYASKSLSTFSQDTTPSGLAFSSDGTKAYVVGTASDTVYQYTLTTAWDISTGSYASKSMSVAAQETAPRGLAFSSDGTKAYVVGTGAIIYRYTLSTAWDISTGSYLNIFRSVSDQASSPTDLTVITGVNFACVLHSFVLYQYQIFDS